MSCPVLAISSEHVQRQLQLLNGQNSLPFVFSGVVALPSRCHNGDFRGNPLVGLLMHCASSSPASPAGGKMRTASGKRPLANNSPSLALSLRTCSAAHLSPTVVHWVLVVSQAGQLHLRCHRVPCSALQIKHSDVAIRPHSACLAWGHSSPARIFTNIFERRAYQPSGVLPARSGLSASRNTGIQATDDTDILT